MFVCGCSPGSQQTVAAIPRMCNHMKCLNCFIRQISQQQDGMTYVCQDCSISSPCLIAGSLANGFTFQLAAKIGVAQVGSHFVQTPFVQPLRQFLFQNYSYTIFYKAACQQQSSTIIPPQPQPIYSQCSVCKLNFQPEMLQQHIIQTHPKCPKCGGIFPSPHHLDAHMKQHINPVEEDTKFNELVTSIVQRDTDSPINFDPFSDIPFKVDDPNAGKIVAPVAPVDSPDTEPEYVHDNKRCNLCNENVPDLAAHNTAKNHIACNICTKLAVKKKAFLRFQMHTTQDAVFKHMHDDHTPCDVCGDFYDTPKVWLLHKQATHATKFTEENRINLANQPTNDRRDYRDLLKRLRTKYPK